MPRKQIRDLNSRMDEDRNFTDPQSIRDEGN